MLKLQNRFSCDTAHMLNPVSQLFDIMQTCPCNEYPLVPHFYIEKTGVYRGIPIFLIFPTHIDCGYSLEHSLENPQSMCHTRRKAASCLCGNKDTKQLGNNCTADQRLCFCYTDSADLLISKPEIVFATRIVQTYMYFFLNLKLQASSLLL